MGKRFHPTLQRAPRNRSHPHVSRHSGTEIRDNQKYVLATAQPKCSIKIFSSDPHRLRAASSLRDGEAHLPDWKLNEFSWRSDLSIAIGV